MEEQPTKGVNRSAQQRCCWFSVAIRAPAPGYTRRYAPLAEASIVLQGKKPLNVVTGLADLVIGTYHGDVIADSKGSSRSDIVVTITRIDRSTVRVASDYHRIGAVDVELTRIDNKIFNAGGSTTLILDLDRNPPTLSFDPRGELAYSGNKQQ